MANGNMKLSLVLTARDDGARRLLADTQRQLDRTAKSRAQLERQSHTYALTGIRSEKQIQREIMLTQAAFNRLARSGKASQNDLARAAVATRNRIRELNVELKQGAGFADRMGKIGRAGAAVAAGGAAAYAVLKPAMNDRKQLDENINRVARQAFIEDDSESAAWIATEGARQVKDLALELVQKNGGNHDKALDVISGMMTTGLNFSQTKEEAQAAYAFSLASEMEGAETSKLIKALKDNLPDTNLQLALEHVLQSGYDGTFETQDMVRELPALLPAAQQAGMTGIGGLDYLLSLLQSAANKSGSPAEAATNVQNLLSKTLSPDTIGRLKKMANPNDPKKGVDWVGSVLKGKENGENAVQVLSRLADAMLSRDKQYQEYQARAAAGDKTAAEQANMMKAALLATLLPDLQAKQGLLAATDMAQIQGYMAKLGGVTLENGKIGKINEARMMTDAAKQEQAESVKILEESLTKTLVKAETAFKQLAAEYPNATLALQALTTAATAASAAMLLTAGGGKGAGFLKDVGSKALGWGKASAGGVAAGATAAGGKLLSWGKSAGSGLMNNPALVKRAGLLGMLLYSESLGDGTLPKGLRGTKTTPEMINRLKNNGIRFEPAPKREQAQGGVPQYLAAPSAQPTDKMLSPLFSTQTAAYQAAIQQQTAAYQAALAQDTAAVTTGLAQVQSAMASASQTINTNVSLNIDGRVIANEVSRYQVAMFGRGAGQ
ncbi:phage tail tape measure protein [Neisseria subflava]|uniref:phage tail tape measure protein n=1 Tax=Neisseria TaxID=482 RepID=UPI00202A597A|nr:phage tail tape measure protein [Neisseria subflava]MCL9764295.1 PRTRC system protein F [Neisseria subflava]